MFTDTAQRQTAYHKLTQFKMNKDDLDTYISTFNNLIRKANYDRDAEGTIHFFRQGLNRELLKAILTCDAQPTTLTEWETAARTEQRKHVNRQAILHPERHHYKWAPPPHNGNRHYRRHPNDETVPMDVDTPVFTQVSRAYSEEDKNCYRSQGRCFRCDKQGHMAKECPERKQQSFNYKPKPQYNPNFKKKKPFGQSKRSSHKPRSNQRSQRLGYTPQARVASIEEMSSDSDNENDDYDHDDNEGASLAARTAKLSDNQKEAWLNEMRDMGIKF